MFTNLSQRALISRLGADAIQRSVMGAILPSRIIGTKAIGQLGMWRVSRLGKDTPSVSQKTVLAAQFLKRGFLNKL